MLPKNYPHRQCTVPGFGVLSVPRYIDRIDVDNSGKRGTHGWRVRYKKPFKVIQDINKELGLNSPADSLKAAITYLASLSPEPPKSKVREKPRVDKVNAIRDVGIRLVSINKPKKYYIEVSHPNKKVDPTRIYIGTENTFNEKVFIAALQKAREIRKVFVKNHEDDLRSKWS